VYFSQSCCYSNREAVAAEAVAAEAVATVEHVF